MPQTSKSRDGDTEAWTISISSGLRMWLIVAGLNMRNHTELVHARNVHAAWLDVCIISTRDLHIHSSSSNKSDSQIHRLTASRGHTLCVENLVKGTADISDVTTLTPWGKNAHGASYISSCLCILVADASVIHPKAAENTKLKIKSNICWMLYPEIFLCIMKVNKLLVKQTICRQNDNHWAAMDCVQAAQTKCGAAAVQGAAKRVK